MEVQFTSEQKAFVRQAIETGRLQLVEDVKRRGLARLAAENAKR